MLVNKHPRLDRLQVTAFRLTAHNLCARLPAERVLEAAGICGLQNSPPGSAELALGARVDGLEPGHLESLLIGKKTLIQMWSMRAAPHIFPTSDLEVFTLGMLPDNESDILYLVSGIDAGLKRLGIGAQVLVNWAAKAAIEALDERGLTKDKLGVDVARRLEIYLNEAQLETWREPSWVAPGQSLGQSVVRFGLPLVALQGLCCHAERRAGRAYLRRLDQWLGQTLRPQSLDSVRTELARRYLHAYGPSSVAEYSDWTGLSRTQAAYAWELIRADCIQVEYSGRQLWLLHEDLERLFAAELPTGVRLLPPHDPYLAVRDRSTMMPDRSVGRRIWRAMGSPGVILANGLLAGLWRSTKVGGRLKIVVEPLTSLELNVRVEVEVEAASLAELRSCQTVDVAWL